MNAQFAAGAAPCRSAAGADSALPAGALPAHAKDAPFVDTQRPSPTAAFQLHPGQFAGGTSTGPAGGAPDGHGGQPAAPAQPGPPRRRAQRAAAQRAAAAVSAVAQRELGDGKRRGRPPSEGLVYSKAYTAVKNYRQRQKNMVGGLETELASKLESMRLLVACNEALVARERVLLALVDRSTEARQLLRQEQERTWGGGGGSGGAGGCGGSSCGAAPQDGNVPASGTTSCETGLSEGAQTRSDGSGPIPSPSRGSPGGSGPHPGNSPSCASDGGAADSGTPGQASGRADAGADAGAYVGAGAGAPPRPASVREFTERYRVYVDHVRSHRLLPDGSILQLPPGDPWREMTRDLVDAVMAMPMDDAWELLATNLETGGRHTPEPGAWVDVARRLRLTPEEQARVMAAWLAFEGAMARLCVERHDVQRRLAALQGRPPDALALASASAGADEGGGGGGGGDGTGGGGGVEGGEAGAVGGVAALEEEEELAQALQANMNREDHEWGILSWTLTHLCDEHHTAHMCALAYPFMPSISQVYAAYVTAVLGHKSRV